MHRLHGLMFIASYLMHCGVAMLDGSYWDECDDGDATLCGNSEPTSWG